jgi:hypothetical protein
MAKLCPARTTIIIILSIAVLYALFQYVKTHDSINDTFKIGPRPCLSRQIRLLNRVTSILENNPNNVTLQKFHWILWHSNLNDKKLNEIENTLNKM